MKIPRSRRAANTLAAWLIRRSVTILPSSERSAIREEWLGELAEVSRRATSGWRALYAPLSFALGQRETSQILRACRSSNSRSERTFMASALLVSFGPLIYMMTALTFALPILTHRDPTPLDVVALCASVPILLAFCQCCRWGSRRFAVESSARLAMHVMKQASVVVWSGLLMAASQLALAAGALLDVPFAVQLAVSRESGSVEWLDLATLLGCVLVTGVGGAWLAWRIRRSVLLVAEVRMLSAAAEQT
jgi:hypothetical protein